MLKSKKNVFWEALVLTVVVFFLGLFLGVAIENLRVEKVEEYYAQSEIASLDLFVLNNLVDLDDQSCGDLVKANFDFADRIYFEARLLEKYEDSGRITDKIKLAHQKYDLLRTFLWINADKTLRKCEEDFNIVVYLYEYDPVDLTQKAEQKVWSRVLGDLKERRGEDVLLIPIAVNNDLVSLDAKLSGLGISKFPVVVINGGKLITQISSVEVLEGYLD